MTLADAQEGPCRVFVFVSWAQKFYKPIAACLVLAHRFETRILYALLAFFFVGGGGGSLGPPKILEICFWNLGLGH